MTVLAEATAPVALVTGVSSGIGRAIATRLLDQGGGWLASAAETPAWTSRPFAGSRRT